ncbi:MAG: ATP-dependent DNA helicase RecG [Actinomycetia bacterium]|nr:ATP-dependent DNA helicase RecG [Actinomycetes bacterium]
MTDSAAWLRQPLREVVGGATAKALAAMALHTVGDLLDHLPRRYGEHGQLSDIGRLQVGEQATVLAQVASVTSRRMRQRKGTICEVVVTDGRQRLSLTFFNQPWRERQLQVGMRGLFAGTVDVRASRRQLTHPDYVIFGEDDAAAPTAPDATALDADVHLDTDGDIERDLLTLAEFTGYLIPIYPATAALPTWRIQKAVAVLLDTMPDLPGLTPPAVAAREGLMTRTEAYLTLHRPRSMDEVDAARRRLAYDEALVLQTVLARRRAALAETAATPRVPDDDGLLTAFDARLPFVLTTGQRDVTHEIGTDLAQTHPMHRLLQGEVGSGKTVVALRAMVTVVDAGGQAALLAPTEVLAQQHFRTMTAMLGPLADGGLLGSPPEATRVRLLTGSQPAAVRRATLLDIASGDAGIVVGTHALLQEHVDFFDLGLVVIDEQHRFGVEQREALRAKAQTPPHVLVMTATPIPRTVAMTIFGDLDVSTLTELPEGRQQISTHVVPAADRPKYLDRAWERITEEVAKGRQAYVVCPRIGDDLDGRSGVELGHAELGGAELGGAELGGAESGGAESGGPGAPEQHSVLALARLLADGPLADCRVGVLHGQLPSDVKESVMSSFGAGEIDVLVATTVIEVGVDVPNASVMVVMDADRFGVSQLHQIRGRVGRGDVAGLCLLVTELSDQSPARDRLDAVAGTTDGFVLARVDLEQRREGDVLGAAQSGVRSSLKVLRAVSDEAIIVAARSDAVALVADDASLNSYPDLEAAVTTLESHEQAEYLEKS